MTASDPNELPTPDDVSDAGFGEVLAGLDDVQARAVTSPAPLLAIVAGAGSGKTSVLTRRVAYRALRGDTDARHSVVLTFTRQAAYELKRRLKGFGLDEPPTAGTFHAVCLALLRQKWDDEGRRHPTVVSDRTRLVAEVLGESRRGRLHDLVAEIDWARARRLAPDEISKAAKAAGRPTAGRDLAKVMADVAGLKRKRGIVDLDDLLELVVSSLDDPAFAAATRWRFRHFYVDEAQDLNPLQHAVLSTLLGDRTDLTLVGDPAQAIYGFNGSDPRFLAEVERYFPGVEIVRLDTNYRCTPEIVATGLHILSDDPSPTPPLVSSRPSGIAPTSFVFDDEEAEAAGVAQLVAEAKPAFARWRDMAVLARTNAQLALVHEALKAVGVPSILSGVAADPVQQAVRAAGEQTSRARLAMWSHDARQPDADLDDSAIEARRRVADAVDEFLADGGRDGLGFMAWVRTNRPFQADRAEDGVELLTFHAAKGREWFGVTLIGCEIGLVPHSSARTPDALAEEARLAYVAVTRASDRLLLTSARSRRGKDTRPSSFLAHLPTAPPPAPPSADFLDGQRRRRESVDSTGDALLDALVDWRSRTARVSGVAPTLICSDRALADIASRRPTNVDELAAVPGVGAVMARRVGDRVLELIRSLR
ncbi:MAG: ATP-dependent helicase [Actinomycetota bacterium]